ncbi:hypothetical protein TOT_020000519 [Theileria orientalis strain Shintoku]|uniref:Uncharacterized protein n=1 Tax=Theileria orientalis strain Shintoku TaxID=869250 RepID=J4DP83_THEOR|nr:hypothetical protein TOT_020000519 [Theileria orientalis strain Shintoku]PVC51563.1 hypothetical protein MACL_00001434 [Theileria orientalis]BAM40259.1 hypothetical protein TOT_020000519 [Theileria orientalis strain Shintoku]|eukprot:XP_009690560.1 hypothetical protein TOT_020000519 [Theileria orientalis strain Shintoku]
MVVNRILKCFVKLAASYSVKQNICENRCRKETKIDMIMKLNIGQYQVRLSRIKFVYLRQYQI